MLMQKWRVPASIIFEKKKKKKNFSPTRAGSDILSVCLSVRPSVRSQKIKVVKSSKKHFVFDRN